MNKKIKKTVVGNVLLKKAVGGIINTYGWTSLLKFNDTMIPGIVLTQAELEFNNALGEVSDILGTSYTNFEALAAVDKVLKAFGGTPGGGNFYTDEKVLMHNLGFKNWG